MAWKKFECVKCGRLFSMPGHLARHMNATHGHGKMQVKSPVAGNAKRVRARQNRRTFDRGFGGNAELSNIVTEIGVYRNRLLQQRDSIEESIKNLDAAIQAIGGKLNTTVHQRSRTSVRRFGKRSNSLKEFIVRVLRSRTKPMGPHEIAQAVKASGYKTQSNDLTNAVGNALSKMKDVKRVGYGLYRA